MGYSKREIAMVVAILAMSLVADVASAGVTCGTVSGDLAQCLGYLVGSAPAPSGQCCSGVKSLYSATKASRPDRITSCGCIKSLAATLGNKLQPARVSSLPGQCNVNLGYSISTSTNCNTIP